MAPAWHIRGITEIIMKKPEEKYHPKEIAAIALVWLFAIMFAYVVYLKIRMLHL